MKWLKVHMKAQGQAVIAIQDDITDEGWGFSDADFAAMLQAFSSATEITIEMNSWGGDPRVALRMVEMMEMSDATFTCRIVGVCASSATLIACACDKVTATPDAAYGAHEASAMPEAFLRADDLRSLADYVDEINAAFVEAYTKKTGKTEEDIRALMKESYFEMAEQALEAGFIDEIIAESDMQVPRYTSIAAKIFKKHKIAARMMAQHDSTPSASQGTQTPTQKNTCMNEEIWKKIKAAFGWTGDDTDSLIQAKQDSEKLSRMQQLEANLADVQAKLSKEQTEKAELQAKLDTYAESEKAALQAKIKQTLDDAIADFRISASQRDAWESKLKADFDGTVALLPAKDDANPGAKRPQGGKPAGKPAMNARYNVNPEVAKYFDGSK